MKICILTYPPHANYGALLQTYALQKVLRDQGHDVVSAAEKAARKQSVIKRVIKFAYHFIQKYILRSDIHNPYQFFFTSLNSRSNAERVINANIDRFVSNNIRTAPIFKGRCYPKYSDISKFDALVVGSDQVWRAAYMNVGAYFLNFRIPQNTKCIAYAASFGTDNLDEFTQQDMDNCRNGVKNFCAVSVREDSGIKLCKDNFNVDAIHLLDPTMLLDKSDYIDLIEESDAPQTNVLMCYILDKTNEKTELINQVAEKINLHPQYIVPEQRLCSDTIDLSKCIYPSVSSWLAGYRDAEFVVTDSFHGTVFAIIFNKPFVVINNSKRGSARFNSLLKMFGLEHRMISSISDLNDDLIANIDYTRVNKLISYMKQKSMDFLSIHILHS